MKNNNKNLSTSGKANSGVNGSNGNVIKAFRMPEECTFCYLHCGDCRYYETENFSGYCGYHRRNISSTDAACSQYS